MASVIVRRCRARTCNWRSVTATTCCSRSRKGFCLFFFQAEDVIRDKLVTGVQTCALPICLRAGEGKRVQPGHLAHLPGHGGAQLARARDLPAQRLRAFGRRSRAAAARLRPGRIRSEERRVGKECRSRWWPDQEKKTKKMHK